MEIPDGVLILTAGVDVGERFLNYEVVGWGKGRESWGIEYGILDGDPRANDVWKMVDEVVYNRLFTTSDSKKMRVAKIAVDSGYASDWVYQYTKRREPRCIACKGEGGLRKPLLKGSTVTKTNRARLIILGVDSGKEEITNRLRISTPGPGFCHFPRGENDEPCQDVREITFRSAIFDKRVRISSWIPSAKYALALSSLRFSNGSTAMLFSAIGSPPSAAFAEEERATAGEPRR
jgi:phage terminase large subunit GpA-like protein